MEQIRALCPADADAVLTLWIGCLNRGEVLYRTPEREDFLARFFAPGCQGFVAEVEGRVAGWAHCVCPQRFLPGETADNTPLFLTLVMTAPELRGQGIGTALVARVLAHGRVQGKRQVVVSGNNPVHLTWLIPGAGGHDHNNAPGVWEDSEGFRFLAHLGFHDDFHEISMYMPMKEYRWDPALNDKLAALDGVWEDSEGFRFLAHLGFHDDFHEISMYMPMKEYRWDPALNDKLAALDAEGIRVGRWEPGLGEAYDGMCDRVGSEYWRNVLRQELHAWHTGQPNADPELWPDGIRPAGPRPLLTATHGPDIIGFTGPVDLQRSGRGWFTGICTDPDWGGRGIASVLFNLLMKEFADEGAAFCSLFTGAENHAQKIYLRAGLRITSRWAVMSLPLTEGVSFTQKYF